MTIECQHADSDLNERGNRWCRDCRKEMTPDGTVVFEEEGAEEQPYREGGGESPSYRASMRDAGRGHLLR